MTPTGFPLTRGEFQRWLATPAALHLLLGLVVPMLVLTVNMWAVHRFTVDDSYISFRYARNLADGHGLVYNIGERVEGYTNLLFTVLLAGGYKIGVPDPHITAKVLGAASAYATMVLCYRLSQRLLPYSILPAVSPWLLASSTPFSGYAVFGLESTMFTFLVLWGLLRFFDETETGRFPWSGPIFALAGLTRPEAPMYLGLPMLLLGRRFFDRQNILRGVVFALPLLVQLLWRHSYYGEWLPATFTAKTGDMTQQFNGARNYLRDWFLHTGPVVLFGLYGLTMGLIRRQRELMSVASIGVCSLAYILLVGGDWMPYYRFLVPIEPFVFLLVDVALRNIFDKRDKAANIALGVFALYIGGHRVDQLHKARGAFLKNERQFWQNAAGATADWLRNQPPGVVAIGDIGYVGYKTNYPILDLLGLVDPVIAKLPGGYTRKLGSGFVERFYQVMPDYTVIILSGQNCDNPQMEGSRLIYHDPRFKPNYELGHNVQVNAGASWCIFRKKSGK